MQESILNETKYIMKQNNILANKSLGQNFLIDDETVYNIVDSANLSDEDLVIEIGPGLGTLTARLIQKAKKVIAIELDERMIKILNQRFSTDKNFEVIYEDILKVDLNKLITENKGECKNVKIVANLPYYITTPIIMKLLEEKLDIDSITVMVQKEVADRLTCIPGSKLTGAITYSVYYYSEPKEICFVDKNSFIPAPEVDSKVIQLKVRKESLFTDCDEEMLFKVIKASFMQRRKTLLNGLVNSGIASKEKVKEAIFKIKQEENIRGEKLKIEQFAELSKYLK